MVNNMARYIDADKLMEEINNRKFGDDAKKMNVSEEEMNGFFIGYMEGLIKLCVPTAYNVDRVVEEIHETLRPYYILNTIVDDVVRKGGVE